MNFDISTEAIHQHLTPLGFVVEANDRDENYLRITHPDHVGTVITVSIVTINNLGIIDDLYRRVESGPELELLSNLTQADVDSLTKDQVYHLFHIQFSEQINPESLYHMKDFVSLVQQKIVPITTL